MLRLYKQELPEPTFVQLPDIPLRGSTVSYSISYRRDGTLKPRSVLQHWQKFRNLFTADKPVPPRFFALLSGETKKTNEDEQQLYYTCAVDSEYAPEEGKLSEYHIPAGEYARFTYVGTFRGLTEFIVHVYCDVMPLHKLTRRASPDIEIFPTSPERPMEFGIIQCDYYIPIRRPEESTLAE
ncbi:MAG TPA: hypothetical protein DCF88_09310 [Plesiomonas shigelloides]|nr:hypothetical protein [Plesiomonas shigelloides]